jgi:CheY-like chemotaxis protein
MTTLVLALPLSNPIRGPVKKRRVLLVDTSPSKRELRAETMRRLGMDVDCAADISEARSWWRADLYNLVLINMENEQGHRDKFCDDVRSATPPQQLAFLVGKPEYLADSPNTNVALSIQSNDVQAPQDEMRTAPTADISGGPPLRWGILEASRRISAVRSASAARSMAMRNRPSPPRDVEARYSKPAPAEAQILPELQKEEMQ